jgi:miniconductance mechanosensitive channel
MDIIQLEQWIQQNPFLAFGGVVLAALAIFFIARLVVGYGLTYLAKRTENKYDDIIVEHLHPFRVAWLAPFILVYIFAYLVPEYQDFIEIFSLFFILWISILTLNALLSAMNQVYEASPSFTGVSIQGYLDIVKILAILTGIILSISLITGESPLVLLTGLGALTAVLLLIFKDTILSLVASIQIAAHDLIKEGDWIEVPSYGADGDVINMSLHTIKVQNFDKTITIIPTYKMIDVAYKNWRGMTESGGRRIKRSINIDLNTIRFCTPEMIARYRKADLLADYLDEAQANMERYIQAKGDTLDFPIDGPQPTNIQVFHAYINAYLQTKKLIHGSKMTLLVRQLAPGPQGLPIEIYAFTKTVNWEAYENIQAEIFDHLLAAVSYFDLRIFQEPTGSDFSNLGGSG